LDVDKTQVSGAATDGSYINHTSTPRFFYPIDLDTGTTYSGSFLGNAFQTGVLSFPTDQGLQENKLYCTNDTEEIELYDVFDPEPGDGKVTYEPGVDHPALKEQIVDYILLREVSLPETVYAYNPYQDKFLVSYDGSIGAPSELYTDFQSLQFIYCFNPDGRVELYEWTYDPEPFPDGRTGPNAGLAHGRLVRRFAAPDVYYFFFVTEECVDPENGFRVMDTRRSQNSASGRLFSIWPLNGRYFVDDYAPNDYGKYIPTNDPKLDISDAASGFGQYIPVTAYRRNFLVSTP
jgi:hypothetical protein